jgi:UDP-glucuronate decarboxylase
MLCQALANDDITVYGDGSQTRSFCYVDDMVDGLIRLMRYDGDQPGPINLGNPVELAVMQLVGKIVTLTGSSSRIVYRPLPADDPTRRRPDITEAGQMLGWFPSTDLDAGLRTTAEWFGTDRIQPLVAAGSH